MPGLEMSLAEFGQWCGRKAEDLRRIDLRPAWDEVTLLLASATRLNIEGAHTPEGTAWLPFKRKPGRKRGGASAKLLRDKGLLMGSYTAGAQYHVDQRTADTLAWGSDLDRAAWHQDGTKTIPAREQAGWTPQLTQNAAEIVLDKLRDAYLA